MLLGYFLCCRYVTDTCTGHALTTSTVNTVSDPCNRCEGMGHIRVTRDHFVGRTRIDSTFPRTMGYCTGTSKRKEQKYPKNVRVEIFFDALEVLRKAWPDACFTRMSEMAYVFSIENSMSYHQLRARAPESLNEFFRRMLQDNYLTTDEESETTDDEDEVIYVPRHRVFQAKLKPLDIPARIHTLKTPSISAPRIGYEKSPVIPQRPRKSVHRRILFDSDDEGHEEKKEEPVRGKGKGKRKEPMNKRMLPESKRRTGSKNIPIVVHESECEDDEEVYMSEDDMLECFEEMDRDSEEGDLLGEGDWTLDFGETLEELKRYETETEMYEKKLEENPNDRACARWKKTLERLYDERSSLFLHKKKLLEGMRHYSNKVFQRISACNAPSPLEPATPELVRRFEAMLDGKIPVPDEWV